MSSPTPSPDVEAGAIREQVERITASAAFRSSKRYPDFLRYTVEHTLSGNIETIKERVLGVEVFGRDPNYDTSLDPVVRMTAAEVRKRLEQYYRARGREDEVRIDYPRGSYVPEFSWPKPDVIGDGTAPRGEVSLKNRPTNWRKLLYAGLACLAVTAAL